MIYTFKKQYIYIYIFVGFLYLTSFMNFIISTNLLNIMNFNSFSSFDMLMFCNMCTVLLALFT